MGKTIFRIGQERGFLAGRFRRGLYGGKLGSVAQVTHDGDTVNVGSDENFAIRFLGIDTPEVSFIAPDTGRFTGINKPVFEALLADPVSSRFGPMTGLTDELSVYLDRMATPDAATRHHAFAKQAEDALEALQDADIAALGETGFFLAFAYDVLDHYGRLLAYVFPNEPDTPAHERRDSYNTRLLAQGWAAPYFIFPNVDPFNASDTPLDAALMAQDPPTILARAPKLRAARAAVAQARAEGRGIFDPAAPNIFDPFELRFIARRRAPSRWVIDLSRPDRVLLPPAAYIHVPHAEDRLWVPPEFVPLFKVAGWRLDGPIWFNL